MASSAEIAGTAEASTEINKLVQDEGRNDDDEICPEDLFSKDDVETITNDSLAMVIFVKFQKALAAAKARGLKFHKDLPELDELEKNKEQLIKDLTTHLQKPEAIIIHPKKGIQNFNVGDVVYVSIPIFMYKAGSTAIVIKSGDEPHTYFLAVVFEADGKVVPHDHLAVLYNVHGNNLSLSDMIVDTDEFFTHANGDLLVFDSDGGSEKRVGRFSGKDATIVCDVGEDIQLDQASNVRRLYLLCTTLYEELVSISRKMYGPYVGLFEEYVDLQYTLHYFNTFECLEIGLTETVWWLIWTTWPPYNHDEILSYMKRGVHKGHLLHSPTSMCLELACLDEREERMLRFPELQIVLEQLMGPLVTGNTIAADMSIGVALKDDVGIGFDATNPPSHVRQFCLFLAIACLLSFIQKKTSRIPKVIEIEGSIEQYYFSILCKREDVFSIDVTFPITTLFATIYPKLRWNPNHTIRVFDLKSLFTSTARSEEALMRGLDVLQSLILWVKEVSSALSQGRTIPSSCDVLDGYTLVIYTHSCGCSLWTLHHAKQAMRKETLSTRFLLTVLLRILQGRPPLMIEVFCPYLQPLNLSFHLPLSLLLTCTNLSPKFTTIQRQHFITLTLTSFLT